MIFDLEMVENGKVKHRVHDYQKLLLLPQVYDARRLATRSARIFFATSEKGLE